ncbi:hypothetical protein PIROE2DRAFT_15300, partial [Piromyces sp. E2]
MERDKYCYERINLVILSHAEYIKQSMINRIPKLEWLDDKTIEYAIKKVEVMTGVIGYSETSINLDSLYE